MKKIIFGLIMLSCSLMQAELYNDHVPGALSSDFRQLTNTELDQKYTNTQFLRNYDKVRKELKKDFGFTETFIRSEDAKITCDALVLKRRQAKYTVIMAPGFYLGRGEGNAGALCALAQFKNKENPNGVNIIVLHTRYHGPKGRGLNLRKLLSPSNVFNLGEHEYKDLIATYNYATQNFHGSEILGFGVCAGAFNMINAHKALTNQAEVEQTIQSAPKDGNKIAPDILPKIKGYWFDSPWVDPLDTIPMTLRHEVPPFITKPILPKFLQKHANKLIGGFLAFIGKNILAQAFHKNPASTKDTDKTLEEIEVPVVCCASKHDPTTPLSSIRPVLNTRRLEKGNPTFLLEPDYQDAAKKKTQVRHTESFVKQYERHKMLLHCWLGNPNKKPTLPRLPKPTQQPEQPALPDKSLSGLSTLEKWQPKRHLAKKI